MAIQLYKTYNPGQVVTSVGGIWRDVTDAQQVLKQQGVTIDTLPFVEPTGTSGGAMDYNALLTHQAGIEEQARIKAMPQTTFDPTKAQASTFRPIGSGEDLTSYLQTKQAHEIQQTGTSTVNLGQPTQPITPQVAVAQPASQAQPVAPQAPTPQQPAQPTGKYVQYAGSPDIFDASGRYISAQEAASIPNFQSQVQQIAAPRPDIKVESDFAKLAGQNITQMVKEAAQPSSVQQPQLNKPPVIQQPELQKQAQSGLIPLSQAQTTAGAVQKPYVQYEGSPDVFERATGKYISGDEASKIPDFFSQVEKATSVRPGITTEEDFAKLAKTNLQLQQSGATTTEQDFKTNPLKAFQDTYRQIWDNLGLNNVKEQIKNTINAKKEVDNEMIDKIAEVNDNPWISEAERSRQITKLTSKYEQKNAANVESLKLLQGVFEMGQQEAQFVTTNALNAFNQQQTFDQQVLLKQMDLAEKLTDISKNVKEVNGGLYNIATNEWIVKPKGTEYKPPVSYQEWDLAGRPGEYADWVKKDTTSGLTDVELARLDKTKEAENLKLLTDLKSSAGRYKDALDTYGYQAIGTGKTILDNTYAELQVKWKEAARLGALTGPDLQLILDAVKPATGIRGATSAITGGGISGITAGVDQMIGRLNSDGKREFELLTARNSKYPTDPYVMALGSPFTEAQGYTPGSVISNNGIMYIVEDDGETLTPIGSAQ